MRTTNVLMALTILLTTLEWSRSQDVLPDAFCTYCAFRFRKEGCLQKESLLCKFLAFKFNASFGGRAFCPQFTCQGYGVTGHQCKGLFSCPFKRIRTKGICPLSKVCCAN